jgi:malate synthase
MRIEIVNLDKYKDTILTDEAIFFVVDLVNRFAPRVNEILFSRQARQALLDRHDLLPYFLPNTAHIRGSDWTVASLPADLLDRRVEITGPTERKMIINALNSGANVFMADLEDSNSPTWENMMQGQVNLMDAVRRTITFTSDAGKDYKLNEKTAVLMVRPRGWHLVEKNFMLDNMPIPAALLDFGLYFFHNVKELMERGTAPYFYLPKMESYLEARLWNDIFVYSQKKFKIPKGTIKATCLIENIYAAFEMNEFLWELKDHSAGLNCGRWDYLFSFIKKFANKPEFILPDRAQLTMDKGFLNAYVQLLIQTCHKRNVHAMGGMAAQIPIKDDPKANEAAMAKVKADKLREVKAGHDGTWVAHPGLVPVARQIFDEYMPHSNQIGNIHYSTVTEQDLLAVPEGTCTEAGLRYNIRVGIRYLAAWLSGQGCVPIYNLMEDAATAEISRSQVWQWLRHKVAIVTADEDKQTLTKDWFLEMVDEEMITLQKETKDFDNGYKARDLFVSLSTAERFEEFLTTAAYHFLK